jgi:hypothetical protein
MNSDLVGVLPLSPGVSVILGKIRIGDSKLRKRLLREATVKVKPIRSEKGETVL